MNSRHAKGITLLELFVGIGVFSLLLTVSVPGFNSFFSRMEANHGVRSITAVFNTARYEAVHSNMRVKVSLVGHNILFMKMKSRRWRTYRSLELEPNVNFTMNASPVFSPFGTVSPLCSTYVDNTHYRYKISISMAGRILVTKLE
jgi:Tfp pilus assembly protein FimT